MASGADAVCGNAATVEPALSAEDVAHSRSIADLEHTRVNIDELLAILDPSKAKATAHLVFIKAEYTPVVPVLSEHVRATVERVGYFELAKALLDCPADEKGGALALDIIALLEGDLKLEHSEATAVTLAVADSKDVAKRAKGFVRQRWDRFGQVVADSRDKMAAAAEGAKEKMKLTATETKGKVEEKMEEARVRVVTHVEEAGQQLNSLLQDESRVLGSRRVKKIAEIASDPEKASCTRVLGSRRLGALFNHFFPPDCQTNPAPSAASPARTDTADYCAFASEGAQTGHQQKGASEGLVDDVESLPPVREGSALDALSALEHAPDSPPTYDEITKLSHKQAPDAVDPAELKGGGGGVDESADLRLQEDEDDATRGLKEQEATVAEEDDKMRESAVVVETQTEVCVERETSRKGEGGKKGKRRGKRGAVVGAQ